MRLQCLVTFTTNCWDTKLRMWSSSASCQNASLHRACQTSTTHRWVSEENKDCTILGIHSHTCQCLSTRILIQGTLCLLWRRCMLWRQCCSVPSVWSKVHLGQVRPWPLRPSSTIWLDKATGKAHKCLYSYYYFDWVLHINYVCWLTFSVCKASLLTFVLPVRCWCVLPVTLPLISWQRRFTRLGWRWWGCVPRAGKPLTPPCPSLLCTTRPETWRGNKDP